MALRLPKRATARVRPYRLRRYLLSEEILAIRLVRLAVT